MAPSKLRKAIGAVKDQTSISLAKVGSSASLADLDVAIVKATRHEECPPEERYICEILNLTTYSRTFISACVSTISRRLGKTKNWVVALKTLMLIHRLLTEGDPAYEQEIFFATRRGTRILNMSDFRDTSGKSYAWDYSAFVRTYALYLDEQLEFRMQGRRGKHGGYRYEVEGEEEEGGEDDGAATSTATVARGTPLRELNIERIFSRVKHLMQLLERFLACRPTGAARDNRVVYVAISPIVGESFQIIYDITEILGILIERFMQLEIPDMIKVQEIFSRVSKQYIELDVFYAWCKSVGIARSSEYPHVEKISQKKIDMMDEYIREKTTMAKNKRAISPEPKPEPEPEPEPEPVEEEAEPKQDMHSIKALPPTEDHFVEEAENEEKEIEDEKEVEEKAKTQEEGDLLHLGEDAPTMEEHSNKLALALFDSGLATTAPDSTTTPWQAFKESGDWEMALVQSTSHLSNQKALLPQGFDTHILDGMYQQEALAQAVASSGVVARGSASSVALGSAGRPALLAFPALPLADGSAASSSAGNTDPFTASLAVPPPPFVQLSEMEKKQRLLVEEQMMWQQYARDGMQGQVGFGNTQHQYNTGGYTRTY